MLVKFDGANPTGSFKDRGMTLAVSKAVEAGAVGRLPRPFYGYCTGENAAGITILFSCAR